MTGTFSSGPDGFLHQYWSRRVLVQMGSSICRTCGCSPLDLQTPPIFTTIFCFHVLSLQHAPVPLVTCSDCFYGDGGHVHHSLTCTCVPVCSSDEDASSDRFLVETGDNASSATAGCCTKPGSEPHTPQPGSKVTIFHSSLYLRKNPEITVVIN